MVRKNKTTKGMNNKRMNNEIYKLRREVLNYIYEIKSFYNIPRIDIRITESNGNILGRARMNDNMVWIPEETVNSKKYDLRTIVYHEVLHAVFGVDHYNDCPLMKPGYTGKLSKTKNKKLFMKYVE